MAEQHLRIDRDGAIAVVTIDRPERRNALHGPLWTALRDDVSALATDPPRVVLLTGAGDHFCAGMDLRPDNPIALRVMGAVQSRDEASVRGIIEELRSSFSALRALPSVCVAAIEGACIGGGLELALAADLRVASTTARFSMPEVRWGMVPDVGGTTRLTRLIGRARAADLTLTGREIDAETALAWGLIDRIAPAGGALALARLVAADVLKGSPAAVRETLGVLRAAAELDESELLVREAEGGARAVCTGEVLEGLTAFMTKRPPSWVSGR